MRIFLILLLGLLALPARAQEGDRGVLEKFLEDKLSQAGREVRVEGFEGALSSQATLESLTIADADGPWLTLTGVTLDWSRAALLRGRLEVEALTAREILLPRLPAPSTPTPKDTAATPFALPDLPVAVRIGKIEAERIVLGAPVLGEAVQARFEGALTLEGGEGAARLNLRRTDGVIGRVALDASYANETRALKLGLEVEEGPGGLVATKAALPGRPALALAVAGDGTLADFAANLTLKTDAVERLAGQLRLTEDATGARAISGDLGGDATPLFVPELRPFFGPDLQIRFAGQQDGAAFDLTSFAVEAAQVQLSGSARVAGGMPERFDVSGRIASALGPVTLPLSGPPTRVDSAQINARFDAAQGDTWQADIQASGVERDGLRLGALTLTGEGRITPGEMPEVTALLDAAVQGLAHDDPALARALGPGLSLSAQLTWQGGPLVIEDIQLAAGDAALGGTARIGAVADGLPVTGSGWLSAGDLARFAPLTGQPLAGGLSATVEGQATVLSGAFDLEMRAEGQSLAIGQAEVDPLLAGASRLAVTARRDETGLTLDRFELSSPAVTASGAGALGPASGQMRVDARLADLAFLDKGLTGPATLSAEGAWAEGTPVTLSHLHATGAGAVLDGQGQIDLDSPTRPASGQITLTARDLSVFSELAGRPLRGAIEASASGKAMLSGGDFDLSAKVQGSGLATGQAEADRLLQGATRVSLQASRAAGTLEIGALNLSTDVLSADLTGRADGSLDLAVRLSDLALLAPDFPGPLSVTGTARPENSDWRLDIAAEAPGNTQARIAGLVAGDGARADLSVTGSAPLGLANAFIAPRSVEGQARFDLRLAGAPGLEALSGRISLADARLSAPVLGFGLEAITGGVELASGQARLDIAARSTAGGGLRLSGPLQLSAPFNAGLNLAFDGFTVEDPALFTTALDGQLALAGPLTGAGRVAGTLDLRETELRVPSGASASGAVPEGLVHLGDGAAVRATRARAGLTGAEEAGGASGPGLGLDLTIRAPRQIFLRGRGLDAELGGQLRLTGTTSNVVPVGRFDLIRGRLDILGKRLTLDEGSASLQGAFDPALRLVASTTSEDTVIQVVIEGPASAPEVTFQSQPDLPQDEVLARLIFGHGIGSLSPFQAAQLASAVATLAGKSDGGLVAKLRQGFGLDDLDITSSDSGETQLKAGKYLSDNLYTDVTVGSEGTTEINLNLDVTPSVTVKGSVGSDGDSGLGVYYQRDY